LALRHYTSGLPAPLFPIQGVQRLNQSLLNLHPIENGEGHAPMAEQTPTMHEGPFDVRCDLGKLGF